MSSLSVDIDKYDVASNDWIEKKVLKTAIKCGLTKTKWETFQEQLSAIGIFSTRRRSESESTSDDSDHEIDLQTFSYYNWDDINHSDLYRICFDKITIDQFHMLLLLRGNNGNSQRYCQQLIKRREVSRKMEICYATDANGIVEDPKAVKLFEWLPFSLVEKKKTLFLSGQKIRMKCTDLERFCIQNTFFKCKLSEKKASEDNECDKDIRHVNDQCRKKLYAKIFGHTKIKDTQKMEIFFALANCHYTPQVRRRTDEPLLKKARLEVSAQKSSIDYDGIENKVNNEKNVLYKEKIDDEKKVDDDEEKVDDDEEKVNDEEKVDRDDHGKVEEKVNSQADYAMAWAVQWLPSSMILGPTQIFSLQTSKKYASITISRFWRCVVYARRWVTVHRRKISIRQTFREFWKGGFAPKHVNVLEYKMGLDIQMMLMAKKRRWRRWLRFRYMLLWVMHPDTSVAEFQRDIDKAWLPKIGVAVAKKYQEKRFKRPMVRQLKQKRRLLRAVAHKNRARKIRKAVVLCKTSFKLLCC